MTDRMDDTINNMQHSNYEDDEESDYEEEYESDTDEASDSDYEEELQNEMSNNMSNEITNNNMSNKITNNEMSNEMSNNKSNINLIISQIVELEKTIISKKKLLLEYKICDLININESLNSYNISNMELTINDNIWSLSYNYKNINIKLEKNNKFYILGNGDKFKIYINHKKRIQIIMKKYEIELDILGHNKLIKNIIKNRNKPEWFAINILSQFDENNWNDDDIMKFFQLTI